MRRRSIVPTANPIDSQTSFIERDVSCSLSNGLVRAGRTVDARLLNLGFSGSDGVRQWETLCVLGLTAARVHDKVRRGSAYRNQLVYSCHLCRRAAALCARALHRWLVLL